MPELPEVETIRRGLQRELTGRTVTAVEARTESGRRGAKRLRAPSPRSLAGLEGQSVLDARRHGKYLMLGLSDGTLLVHLGMTGKLLFSEPGEPERAHTHLVLELDDGRLLSFVDPRRFGLLKLYARDDAMPDLDGFGPDALATDFTPEHLAQQLASCSAPLKAFLMDQSRVAGLGNIYVCEALWRTGLSPKRMARRTPKNKIALLHQSILDVLQDSLAQGGTSFNDYVDHIGQPGKFVAQLAVYDREGQPCLRCGVAVKRITQANRSTFYCPACQK